jgi:hypothetical protein
LVEAAAELNDEKAYEQHYQRLNLLSSLVISSVKEVGTPILLMQMPEDQAGCFLSACPPEITEQLLILRLVDPKISHGLSAAGLPIALERLDSRVLAALIEKLNTSEALTLICSANSLLKCCAALRTWFKEEGCLSHPYSSDGLKDKIAIISGVNQNSEMFKSESTLLHDCRRHLQVLRFIRPEQLKEILLALVDSDSMNRVYSEVGVDTRDILLLAQDEKLNAWALSAAHT